MFGLTWLTFLSAASFSYVIQLRSAEKKLSIRTLVTHIFPVAEWGSKSTRIDVLMYVASKFIGGIFAGVNLATTAGMAGITSFLIDSGFPNHPVYDYNVATIILWSLMFFVLTDFANYLTHYLQHFVPVLWELHKVHHSATFLTPFTTKRMHPFGDQFDGLVAAAIGGVALGLGRSLNGFTLPQMLVMIANANLIGTILVLDSLRHSHFPVGFGPLDKVILSPHMHQLHHSYKVEHWDTNFGNKLSIWDRLFGTLVEPRKGESFPWGLGKAEDADYHTLAGVYFLPLIKIGRLLRGLPSYRDPSAPVTAPAPFFDRVFFRKPAHFGKQPNPSAPQPY
ncbi:sterol desaturase family protein [Phenylobacterium sp.]|uniref:sterol desaturase family protein n=1 Tax=Phenylobacterium sp. TaxID=1871053 RepID=UPI002F41648C